MANNTITVDAKREKLSEWANLTILNVANGKDKAAEIDIEGVIGFEPWWSDDKKTTTKELMKNELKKIANLDVKNITVRINSYGGDVNHGVSMYDLLKEHPAHVTTEVHGHTASAATIIAQAGDNRTMSSTGLYLTHQAQTVAMGTAEDMEASKKTLDTINNQIAEIYAKRSGKTVEEMRAVMDRNRGLGEWLTADEALELGLIDEVYEPMQAAACAAPSSDALKVWNLPEIPNLPEPDKHKKESFNMFDWLKQALNLSPEQAEVLDAIPESVDSVKATMQAQIDTLTAEKEELASKVAEFEAMKEKHANAEALVAEVTAKVAELETVNSEQTAKLAKLTAGIKPIDQDDQPADSLGALVNKIKAMVEETGKSYEECAKAVHAENKEIYNKFVVSPRK